MQHTLCLKKQTKKAHTQVYHLCYYNNHMLILKLSFLPGFFLMMYQVTFELFFLKSIILSKRQNSCGIKGQLLCYI